MVFENSLSAEDFENESYKKDVCIRVILMIFLVMIEEYEKSDDVETGRKLEMKFSKYL